MTQRFGNPLQQDDSDDAAICVTLSLPLDLATVIRQRAQQLGQPPAQVMIEALRQQLGVSQPTSSAASTVTLSSQTLSSEEVQAIAARLAALETLVPKVEQLEATVAALVSQSHDRNQPQWAIAAGEHTEPEPASSPSARSTLLPAAGASLEQCPQCNHRLGPPLKASGRQVCSKCGWTNKPRRATIEVKPVNLSADELQQLLSQATEESLENMKLSNKQDAKLLRGQQFPFFGR